MKQGGDFTEHRLTLFPFRPYDYKSAEEWLNQKAQKGWEPRHIFAPGIASWQRAEVPSVYTIALWDRYTKASEKSTYDLYEFKQQCEELGCEFKGEYNTMCIFSSGPEPQPAPLYRDSSEEADHVKKQFARSALVRNIISFGVSVLLYVLIFYFASFDILASNIMLFGLIFIPVSAVVSAVNIVLLLRFPERIRNSWEKSKSSCLNAVWNKGVLRMTCILLIIVLMVYACIEDMLADASNISKVLQLLFIFLISNIFRLKNETEPNGASVIKIINGCLAAVFLVVSLLTINLKNEDIPREKLEGIPVLAVDSDEAGYNTLTHAQSVFLNKYEYHEGEHNVFIDSYCYDCAFPALADLVYEEVTQSFRGRGNFNSFEHYELGGADSAQLDSEDGILVFRIDNRIVRIEWGGDFDIKDNRFQTLIKGRFLNVDAA